MLVALLEYRRQELQRICGLPADALVTHYALLRNRNEVTVSDVTDTRARKVVNCDFYAISTGGLFTDAVGHIARAVLPPVSSPQVVFVVDGMATTRFHTLLDAEDGLLVRLWRLMTGMSDFKHALEAVYIALVELDDGNHLRDIAAAGPLKEAVVIEDADDHFTSVEDASYTRLYSEEDLVAVLKRARRAASAELHQVFSFILSYEESTKLPNSTIQFVSLAVTEKTRGVLSTRHCISTATSLIESRSPSITFTGTKISYLLKPAFLGQQPGLWVSCFAPVSPLVDSQRETFKEAFAIAYMSTRVYSLRVAVGMSDALQLLGNLNISHPLNDSREHVKIQTQGDVATPNVFGLSSSIARRGEKEGKLSASPFLSSLARCAKKRCGALIKSSNSVFFNSNSNDNDDDYNNNNNSVVSLLKENSYLQTGLLVTPSGERKGTHSDNKIRSIDSAYDGKSENSNNRQNSGHTRRNRHISAEKKHPYNCSARHELETYRRVMESAMEQLRKDLQHYARQLEESRRQVESNKARKSADHEEIKRLRASFLASERRCELLQAQHFKREKELQDKVAELQALCSELSQEPRDYVVPSTAFGQKEMVMMQASVATQTPETFSTCCGQQKLDGENAFLAPLVFRNKTRCESKNTSQDESQWLELIRYHQKELDEYADREQSYRKRILLLEEALSNSEASGAEARRELARLENDALLETVNKQHTEKLPEIDRRFFDNLKQRCAEITEVCKANADFERRLTTCLGELQQERKQREALEIELRRLQAAARAQWSESDAAKEMVRLVESSCELRCARLEREVEELRRLTKTGALRNETAPGPRSCSTASTPRQIPASNRRCSGMISPIFETQAN